MTIDEAIANYQGISIYLQRYYVPDAEVKLQITNAKCIEWFTEVAEWLTEWKEGKRLLKAAVEDFAAIAEVHAAATPILCSQYERYMKAIDIRTRKWRYADEALKLIGGSENG